MARVRLRPARTPAEEQELYSRTYPQGYRHDVWPDHVERVAASVEMIEQYARHIRTAADLSCGDGAILRSLPGLRTAWVGDLNASAPGDWPGSTQWEIVPPGLLPDSLADLPEPVDLYVLSETIEHMDDPDALLRALTSCATYLFLSTPLDEAAHSGNAEHYWSWGQADMHEMLMDAGWSPLEYRKLVPRSTVHLPDTYHYQLWMAVSR